MNALENPTVCKLRGLTLPSLTTALVNADNSIDPDHGGVPHGKNQQNAVGGSGGDRKYIAYSTAKFLLSTVRDSADAFPPLKSVAGGLCSILENYEVRATFHTSPKPRRLESCQRAQGNKQAIESLAPRVISLAESLCAPVSDGDAGEELRRKILKR